MSLSNHMGAWDSPDSYAPASRNDRMSTSDHILAKTSRKPLDSLPSFGWQPEERYRYKTCLLGAFKVTGTKYLLTNTP